MCGEQVKPGYPLSHVTARIIAAAREVHRRNGITGTLIQCIQCPQ